MREDNRAAYDLYGGLGFEHYDSTTQLRRDGIPETTCSRPSEYQLRPASPKIWFSSWSARLDLALRETPQDVQRILPISPAQFKRPGFARFVAPALTRLSGRRVDHVLVERQGRLLATLAVDADLTGERNHEFEHRIDPEHEGALAGPLTDCAFDALRGLPSCPVLMETRSRNERTLRVLADRGLGAIATWHWLGRRLGRESELARRGLGSRASGCIPSDVS